MNLYWYFGDEDLMQYCGKNKERNICTNQMLWILYFSLCGAMYTVDFFFGDSYQDLYT